VKRIAAAALALGALAAKRERMDARSLQLWFWLRHDFSTSVCRVEVVRSDKGHDEETVHLRLRRLETLWGPKGADFREASFTRPVTERARIKFPPPVWGAVELGKGREIFYVAQGAEETSQAIFAANTEADDQTLEAVRQTLRREHELRDDPGSRPAEYLAWLRDGPLVQRLFAGQALSRDALPGVDEGGDVATAMAKLLGDEASDTFLRLAAVEWVHEHIWPRTSAPGRLEIIRADAKALSAKDPNVRQFALDALLDIDPLRLRQEGLSDATVARALRTHAAELDEPRRARLEGLAQAVLPQR